MAYWSQIVNLGPDRQSDSVELGPDPFDGSGNQVGWKRAPLQSGIISLGFPQRADWPDLQVVADITLPQLQILEGVDLPAELATPLPVRVTLRALVPITAPIVVVAMARLGSGIQTGAMRATRPLPIGGMVAIPTWARDVVGPHVAAGDLELGDAAGIFAGELIRGTDFPAPLPTWARFIRQSGADPLARVTFLGGRG